MNNIGLEYITYSNEAETYITVTVYIDKALLKHHLGLRPSQEKELMEKIEIMSSEDVIEIVDRYGCKGIHIN